MRHLFSIKISKRVPRALLPLGIVTVAFCISLALLHAHNKPQLSKETHATIVTAPAKKVTPVETPARLTIDALHIDAQVKPVGVTADGNMAIDESMVNVAWYENGPKPGEVGSAVIAGHYGWLNGAASVFTDLHSLVPGDKIAVYDAQNKPMTFITQKVQRYDMNADTTDVFTSHDGKAHLNLITCDGTWKNAQKTYSQRLVVFADKEPNRAQ